jgi:hypothetical protein
MSISPKLRSDGGLGEETMLIEGPLWKDLGRLAVIIQKPGRWPTPEGNDQGCLRNFKSGWL